MSGDLRWSRCNNDRNKLHNKCNAFESSGNHSPTPLPPRVLGKIVFHETGPWCQEGQTAVLRLFISHQKSVKFFVTIPLKRHAFPDVSVTPGHSGVAESHCNPAERAGAQTGLPRSVIFHLLWALFLRLNFFSRAGNQTSWAHPTALQGFIRETRKASGKAFSGL